MNWQLFKAKKSNKKNKGITLGITTTVTLKRNEIYELLGKY